MAIIQTVDIGGVQNIERYLAEEVFKKIGKHNLEEAKLEGNKLTLTFEDDENISAQNFVKQMNKRKYSSLDAFIKTANLQKCQTFLCIISTKKYNLLFFSEKCRKKKNLWEL